MFYKLKKLCGGCVKKNVSLKNFSTIKIGGRAKFVCYPKEKINVINLVNYLSKKHIKYYVLGNGSNVLISSFGFSGVIIKLDNINEIVEYDNYIQVGAGTMLAQVVNYYVLNGIAGFEQAVGIPGTIGGAVVMNAGAFKFEIKNLVIGVTAIHNGKVEYLINSQCDFSYRHSIFNSDYIILSVDLKKELSDNKDLKLKMLETINSRAKLPKAPSLGSVFKRNPNVIVSKMLDEMGLKGFKVGDAMVSNEHAGVIINLGNATRSDIKMLIDIIKDKALKEKNEQLLEEIRYLN